MSVQLRLFSVKKKHLYCQPANRELILKFLSTNMYYNMDLAVIEAQNYDESLTLQKPTWSVDSNRGYPNGDPSLGVDNDLNVENCMVSSAQPYAWWAVDLGQDVEITAFMMSGYSMRNGRTWKLCISSH